MMMSYVIALFVQAIFLYLFLLNCACFGLADEI